MRVTAMTVTLAGAGSHRLAWLAQGADGVPLGSAFLRLFTGGGREHLAELELAVHPAERRAGVGSRLLGTALAAAREHGRTRLTAGATEDSPGDRFLARRGFAAVLTLDHVRLPLAGTDPAALDALAGRPHPGYRLHAFDGVAPDGLIASLAAARRAMDDMPTGGMAWVREVWDEERVRRAAQAVADGGEWLHTVVALAEADGSVAGFTELVVPGDGRGDALHYGTGVLPEHRGRGLALWMKAEAVRRVRARHPALEGLLADTADVNAPMRAVNEALGYRGTHREVVRQLVL